MLNRVAKLGTFLAIRPPHTPNRPIDPSEAYVAAAQMRQRMNKLAFLALVIVPTLVATVFYALLAAPRYISEAKYLVRSVSSQKATGLDMFFKTFGISRTVDDGYAIQKYILSQDAVNALKEKLPLKAMFQRKNADFFSRYPYFWQQDNDYYLYQYFLDRVSVLEDEKKGITTIRVSTFSPADSLQIANELMLLAEAMVNRLNRRAQEDTVATSKANVKLAEDRVLAAQSELTSFRTRELLVDPNKTSLAYIEMINGLEVKLAEASAILSVTKTLSPTGPQVASQNTQVNAIRDLINAERAKLFSGDASIASKIAEFDKLSLQREIADKALVEARNALETARQEAARQHIYVEQVVKPHLADWPTEPHRLRGILSVFVVGFTIFSVFWILSVGTGEHAQ